MIKKLSGIFLGLIISGVMILSPFFYSVADAATDPTQVNIDDKSFYYVEHYRSGDCVLCANAYMLMREAYFRGSEHFDEITNSTLRVAATGSRHGHGVKFRYSFSIDGLTFNVKEISLKGSLGTKKAKLKTMLAAHPEGVVVRGRAKTGPHGVLLTSYSDQIFYTADSALNFGRYNEGILPYSKTIMRSMSYLHQIWYIESVSGYAKSGVKNLEITDMKYKPSGDGFLLTWDCDNGKTPLAGFEVLSVSTEDYNDGKDFELRCTVGKREVQIEDRDDGKSYLYKIRGYVKNSEGERIYTKHETIKVWMSDPVASGSSSGSHETDQFTTERSSSVTTAPKIQTNISGKVPEADPPQVGSTGGTDPAETVGDGSGNTGSLGSTNGEGNGDGTGDGTGDGNGDGNGDSNTVVEPADPVDPAEPAEPLDPVDSADPSSAADNTDSIDNADLNVSQDNAEAAASEELTSEDESL